MTQPEATTETEIRAETPTGAAANSGRAGRVLRLLIKFCVNVVVPLGGYYVLRWFGVGVYASLLISTLFSAVTTAVPLIRNRRVDGLSLYMTTMLAASVVVSFLAGSPRFLMAKDAWLTGMGGVWFLGSMWTRRPLAYLFTRPLLEGRLGWPGGWEDLWERVPRFRRIWQVSSVLWGIGTLMDAAGRAVMAYTLPVDLVPILSGGLYVVTTVVLVVVTNVYFAIARMRARQW